MTSRDKDGRRMKMKEILDEYKGKWNKKSYSIPNSDLEHLKEHLMEGRLENAQKRICLSLIQFANLESLCHLLEGEKQENLSSRLIFRLRESFPEYRMYTLSYDKILLYAEEVNEEYFCQVIRSYIMEQNSPLMIRELPFTIQHQAAVTEGSVSDSLDELMYRLHRTLDLVCKLGRNILRYQTEASNSVDRFYITLADIINGIKNEEFFLVYQPKVDCEDGSLKGVEVLLRWGRQEYQRLPIFEVIQMAEEMGLINFITEWIIDKVVTQQYVWQKSGIFVKTAINISVNDVTNPNLLRKMDHAIKGYSIKPEYFEIELTEHAIIKDEEYIFHTLRKFQQLGISVSLDDYGTGHNSLIYLLENKFRFDNIKIDKLFIAGIESHSMEALVSGIIEAAHGVQSKVIAEGVEKKAQADALKKLGCDTLQGYYYSKPLERKQFEVYYNLYENRHMIC